MDDICVWTLGLREFDLIFGSHEGECAWTAQSARHCAGYEVHCPRLRILTSSKVLNLSLRYRLPHSRCTVAEIERHRVRLLSLRHGFAGRLRQWDIELAVHDGMA